MALSSLNNICAIKSMIVLQVKCPQLSKPEATEKQRLSFNIEVFNP